MSKTYGGYIFTEGKGWSLAGESAPVATKEAEVEEEEVDTGTGQYEDRTRAQLVELARSKGIKGAAQMKKDELIEELRG